jgi:hypothetical protein
MIRNSSAMMKYSTIALLKSAFDFFMYRLLWERDGECASGCPRRQGASMFAGSDHCGQDLGFLIMLA